MTTRLQNIYIDLRRQQHFYMMSRTGFAFLLGLLVILDVARLYQFISAFIVLYCHVQCAPYFTLSGKRKRLASPSDYKPIPQKQIRAGQSELTQQELVELEAAMLG